MNGVDAAPASPGTALWREVPRLVVAGVHSGVGKTTFTCALLAALRRRQLRVAPFKAGPDYIDPTYHARAAGEPCRNLDTWMLPPAAVGELFARAARLADMALIEGVMGLYDGRGGTASGEGEDEGSTAHLAKLLDAPVVLVVNAAAASRTVAAVVLGCQQFDPAVRLVGVLLSGIASARHLELVTGPITRATGLPVLGYLPRRPEFALPERHLGLVPAGEQSVDDAFFERLAAQAEEAIDFARILALARAAPPLAVPAAGTSLFPPEPAPPQARIALALDDAFHFYYEDGLDLLRAGGAELVPFSPLRDEGIPEGTQAVYLGGGFPEVFAAELAANRPMRAALRAAAATGLPVYGECGGLMYLGQGIVDADGRRHDMVGLVPRWSTMDRPRVTLGYRVATAQRHTLMLPAGASVRGHEFHWSALDAPPAPGEAVYRLTSATGQPLGFDGFATGPRANILGSYVHVHLGADQRLAPTFVAAAAAAEPMRTAASSSATH